ncbi:MAG TPA: hypothetical protein VKZ63_19950 [Kofleriaceae bacterium]|nr:hypothetical protein [Kofleriaceae bacterium]
METTVDTIRGQGSEPVEVESVSDDGLVRVRFAGGVTRTFSIPLERVPHYRRCPVFDPYLAARAAG